MRIFDNFYTKTINMYVKEPYLISLRIIDSMRNFFNVSEKKNEYKTDGPKHISNIEFTITKDIDRYANVKMEFSLYGKDNILTINVLGSVILTIDKFGFFSDIFSQFYLEKIYPQTRKECEKVIEEIKKRFEKIIENI
ncbi:MAG: hypothetical protein QXD48_01645 [Candidatus Aenigmatarchaeota archaeon]